MHFFFVSAFWVAFQEYTNLGSFLCGMELGLNDSIFNPEVSDL